MECLIVFAVFASQLVGNLGSLWGCSKLTLLNSGVSFQSFPCFAKAGLETEAYGCSSGHGTMTTLFPEPHARHAHGNMHFDTWTQEMKVLEMLSLCKCPLKLVRAKERNTATEPRVVVTGAIQDAEALSSCEIFKLCLHEFLPAWCGVEVVRSSQEMLRHRETADYVVVLFTRGLLQDPNFASILMMVDGVNGVNGGTSSQTEVGEKGCEFVPIMADSGFVFPSQEFYEEIQQNGLGEATGPLGFELVQLYRKMLGILALPFSPHGSHGLITRQVLEISWRFQELSRSRSKDPTAPTFGSQNPVELEMTPRPSWPCHGQSFASFGTSHMSNSEKTLEPTEFQTELQVSPKASVQSIPEDMVEQSF